MKNNPRDWFICGNNHSCLICWARFPIKVCVLQGDANIFTYFRWILMTFWCLQHVYELAVRSQSFPELFSPQDTRSNNLEDSALRLWTSFRSRQNRQIAQQSFLSAFLRLSKCLVLRTKSDTMSVSVYFPKDVQSFNGSHKLSGHSLRSSRAYMDGFKAQNLK